MYHVTFSYPENRWDLYYTHLRRLCSAKGTEKFIVARQFGINGDHRHYHVLIQSNARSVRVLRMRFRSIIKEFKFDEISLRTTSYDCPGKWWNYVHRELDVRITNSKLKGWDIVEMKRLAALDGDKKRDPVTKSKPPLFWSQLIPEMKSVGWKYPERPAKYLRLLSVKFYVDNIVLNPKRMSTLFKFYCSEEGQDYDDVYLSAANFATRGNFE